MMDLWPIIVIKLMAEYITFQKTVDIDFKLNNFIEIILEQEEKCMVVLIFNNVVYHYFQSYDLPIINCNIDS